MTLPTLTSSQSLYNSINTVLQQATGVKEKGTSAVAALAAGSVATEYVFTLLDQLRDVITTLDGVKNRPELKTFLVDVNATVAASKSCIDWIVLNFPKDSTAQFLLASSINTDGSRVSRLFTPAQTAGLRTALSSLVATID